jgi:hypothetical protein
LEKIKAKFNRNFHIEWKGGGEYDSVKDYFFETDMEQNEYDISYETISVGFKLKHNGMPRHNTSTGKNPECKRPKTSAIRIWN